MGWQERDWAKWTERERSHFLGSTTGAAPGAFLGVVVSLVAAVVFGQSVLHRPPKPAPVYGDGRIVQLWGNPVTCVEVRYLPSGTICSDWRILVPHEPAPAATPLPPGSRCAIAVADQATRRWTCETPD